MNCVLRRTRRVDDARVDSGLRGGQTARTRSCWCELQASQTEALAQTVPLQHAESSDRLPVRASAPDCRYPGTDAPTRDPRTADPRHARIALDFCEQLHAVNPTGSRAASQIQECRPRPPFGYRTARIRPSSRFHGISCRQIFMRGTWRRDTRCKLGHAPVSAKLAWPRNRQSSSTCHDRIGLWRGLWQSCPRFQSAPVYAFVEGIDQRPAVGGELATGGGWPGAVGDDHDLVLRMPPRSTGRRCQCRRRRRRLAATTGSHSRDSQRKASWSQPSSPRAAPACRPGARRPPRRTCQCGHSRAGSRECSSRRAPHPG